MKCILSILKSTTTGKKLVIKNLKLRPLNSSEPGISAGIGKL